MMKKSIKVILRNHGALTADEEEGEETKDCSEIDASQQKIEGSVP